MQVEWQKGEAGAGEDQSHGVGEPDASGDDRDHGRRQQQQTPLRQVLGQEIDAIGLVV
jgi:hypothetical protein